MRPEPHFFYKSWEYSKGLDYYLERWFNEVSSSALAVGERSSSYLFGRQCVASRIAAHYPDMKFIFTVRNPIERTWANYRYTVLQGLEDMSFEKALEIESARISEARGIWSEIQPHDYTGRGFYASCLSDYLRYFPRSNIHIVKSELLSIQTKYELKKIYGFLNLTDLSFHYDEAPNHTAVSVIDPKLQMELRSYFGSRFDTIIESIRRELPVDSFSNGDEDFFKIKALSHNLSTQKLPMPIKTRVYLQELFAEDIIKLRQFVDFDLSDWI